MQKPKTVVWPPIRGPPMQSMMQIENPVTERKQTTWPCVTWNHDMQDGVRTALVNRILFSSELAVNWCKIVPKKV
jgi:hypothetical protein